MLHTDMFVWDKYYLDALMKIGSNGKKIAKWLGKEKDQLTSYYQNYKASEDVTSLKMFWLPPDDG